MTNMANMFNRATSFNQPLNKWNVSNVTNMACMFYGASSFNQPLNKWNVSNVTDLVWEREKRFYGDGKGERRRTALWRAAKNSLNASGAKLTRACVPRTAKLYSFFFLPTCLIRRRRSVLGLVLVDGNKSLYNFLSTTYHGSNPLPVVAKSVASLFSPWL